MMDRKDWTAANLGLSGIMDKEAWEEINCGVKL